MTFWKVTSAVFNESTPHTIQEKRKFLLRNKIAVWDVIHSCEITGSSDSSIKDVIVNDLMEILNTADLYIGSIGCTIILFPFYYHLIFNLSMVFPTGILT